MLHLNKNIKRKNFFCGYILTEGVYVTQMSSNAGVSVWWIVEVKANYHFISNKDDWADWCSSNSLRLKLEVCMYVFETYACHCCGSPQSLQTNVGIIPWIGQEYFLPNPFLFIIHHSYYHQHYRIWDDDSIAKVTKTSSTIWALWQQYQIYGPQIHTDGLASFIPC